MWFVMLGGVSPMPQGTVSDGRPFDSFPLRQNGLSPSEADAAGAGVVRTRAVAPSPSGSRSQHRLHTGQAGLVDYPLEQP